MRQEKRLLSWLLALLLVIGVAAPVAADGMGSITINNATPGVNYAGYKILDASYTEDDSSVAYTIEKSSPWYEAVAAGASPFDVSAVPGDADTLNVLLGEGTDPEDVLAWINSQVKELPEADLAAVEADSTTVTWSSIAYGYYLITTDLEPKAVTVVNSGEGTQIIDKNQQPGFIDPDPENSISQQGKNVSADGVSYGSSSTASIADTAYFTIDAFVPRYDGDKAISEYVLTDTLAPGFTYNDDLLAKLNGVEQDLMIIWRTETDGSTTLIVTLDVEEGHPSDAKLNLSYTATVDRDAVHNNVNTVDMTWNHAPNDPADPERTPPASETNTYVYGFDLNKYADAVDEANALGGAQFELYDAKTEGNAIELVYMGTENGVNIYRVPERDADGAVVGEAEVSTILAGSAQIFGLAEGTYYLEEVVAPSGYNLLTARVPVELSADATTDGILTAPVNVINSSGTLLPETGGVGTIVFYALGGTLMAVAVVLLIVKRRGQKNEDSRS